MSYSFPREERLTRSADFDRVCTAAPSQGMVLRVKEMVIMGLANEMGRSRLGMVIGRRAGDAVTRTRMKRLVRESFRLNKHLLTAGYDIVVIARADWRDLRLAVVERHVQRFFEMLRKDGGGP